VIRHRRLTHETVLGALCAYILVGLLAVSDLRRGPFFAQPGEHVQSEYLYFSFVTLTTLGFGDRPPSVRLPQALTATDVLLGQIFLVTMVARLVTLCVRQEPTGNGASVRSAMLLRPLTTVNSPVLLGWLQAQEVLLADSSRADRCR